VGNITILEVEEPFHDVMEVLPGGVFGEAPMGFDLGGGGIGIGIGVDFKLNFDLMSNYLWFWGGGIWI